MGMFETLQRLFTGETRAQQGLSQGFPRGINPYDDFWQNNQVQWPTKSIAAYNQQGYTGSALIFRCVRYTADAMGSAPLKVYNSPEDTRRANEIPDHPFRKLMRHPNMGQSQQTFLTYIGVLLCVTGFAVVEKERNALGEVIGLWPLRSDWLKPIPRINALPDWRYDIPGVYPAPVLKADDVIPITYADTIDNSPTGIGPLEAALRAMGIADALQSFVKNFMDRGAMPLYFAIPNDDPFTSSLWNDQATVDAFRRGFQDRFGGLDKATDIAIAPGIKSVERMGLDFDELAYPQLMELNDNAICQAFGISPIVLNTSGGLSQSSYNNAETARRSFYEDTLFPLWGRIDDAFTRHLLSEMDDIDRVSLGFDTSRIPALRTDVNDRWERATDALNVAGITINQFLEEIEHETLGNAGNIYLVPDGVTPIHFDDMATGAVQKAEAEGDIESVKGISKITGKEPNKNMTQRQPDARSDDPDDICDDCEELDE